MEEETSTLMPVPSDIGLEVHRSPAIKKAEEASLYKRIGPEEEDHQAEVACQVFCYQETFLNASVRRNPMPFACEKEILLFNAESTYHHIAVFLSSRHGIKLVALRVAVNSLMSKWRPVTSGIPQGSILGPVLFNIFVGDTDSGIECSLSKFADNTKLCGVVDTLEGRDAMQRDPNRLDRWARANIMKFNKAKYEVLHISQSNPKHKHRLDGEWIDSSPEGKGLEDVG
ncbi:rna-directed dna polymerase from mobile element jockey- hypothetical protein [Limosa lapponica baueri]|uniref:Reverse transcriptase domain-containing protein n=1 Tax=Limosa lapponica baueri TaxID=1758121 RepID=A0A2I0UFM6_LIMLA|nr:rna-directed dna polymerase from mobile element jockey- hypothetical protein [Limosa lapponica baueri]